MEAHFHHRIKKKLNCDFVWVRFFYWHKLAIMRGEKKSELRNINCIFCPRNSKFTSRNSDFFFAPLKIKKVIVTFHLTIPTFFSQLRVYISKFCILQLIFFISIQNCEKSLSCEIKSFFHMAGTFWDCLHHEGCLQRSSTSLRIRWLILCKQLWKRKIKKKKFSVGWRPAYFQRILNMTGGEHFAIAAERLCEICFIAPHLWFVCPSDLWDDMKFSQRNVFGCCCSLISLALWCLNLLIWQIAWEGCEVLELASSHLMLQTQINDSVSQVWTRETKIISVSGHISFVLFWWRSVAYMWINGTGASRFID